MLTPRFYTYDEWLKINNLDDDEDEMEDCWLCDHGYIECEDCLGDGSCQRCGSDCPTCDGRGEIGCLQCNATGKFSSLKEEYERIKGEEADKINRYNSEIKKCSI